MASQSLRVAAFAERPLYDVDGKGGATKLPTPSCPDCAAVVSYPDPNRHRGGPGGFERMANRSYTYDNALVALVRIGEGRHRDARRILATLAALQRSDGGWGFSFNIRGDGFYNAGYVRSGVVAWILYAFARYTELSGDRAFVPVMRKAGGWLAARRDPRNGLIRGGLGRWLLGGRRYEPGFVATWASTEHNVDAWFALRLAARVDPAGRWLSHAGLGAAIHQHLWLPDEGRFARGTDGAKVDRVTALDAAGTWSALFAVASGRPERARGGLTWASRTLGFNEAGWRAHRPDNEVSERLWFVEASVARSMALSRLGDQQAAVADVGQLAQWACVRGVPLAYSSRWVKDFPLTPAAAPTAWFVLAAREVGGASAPFLWRARLP